ncbi:MAG TPA: hypothetical protein VIK22_05410 [Candidatus Anoxymicrobiaceae bacterium]
MALRKLYYLPAYQGVETGHSLCSAFWNKVAIDVQSHAPSKRRSVSDGGATAIDEYNPTPARISEVVSSVTFCLRIDAGELIELDPILQEIFRGELARIWEVVLRATTRPESL